MISEELVFKIIAVVASAITVGVLVWGWTTLPITGGFVVLAVLATVIGVMSIVGLLGIGFGDE